MYQLESRVRYSETDTDARLSLIGIMNYMQDCSTMQSEDLGVGLGYLEEKRKAWLLSSWQIVIARRPSLGERIIVGTWPYAFKGIYALRNFVIFDQDGEMAAKANSCWFLFDQETGRPVRLTRDVIAPYGTMQEPLPMEYAPRKIALSSDWEEAGRICVMRHQIDTNHHVNNAQYVDMAQEVLPEAAEIREIRADYKKAAVLGDEVFLKRGRAEDGYVVSLTGADGAVFANVELKLLGVPYGPAEGEKGKGHA